MSTPRLQPSRISHSVQSHKHTAEARGVEENQCPPMEQDPSPVTPFTRAGELGGLVQSDSTLTAASPLVEARARSKWFRVWNLSAPPNGAGRFGDAKDSADSRGVLLPGPYPKKGNGQQTPLLPDSMAHHPKMAGFCTFPYPLRSRQMLTQGPSQVASDGEPCMTRMRNTRAMSGTIPVALPIRDGVPGGVVGGCARTEPRRCCVSTPGCGGHPGHPRRDTTTHFLASDLHL